MSNKIWSTVDIYRLVGLNRFQKRLSGLDVDELFFSRYLIFHRQISQRNRCDKSVSLENALTRYTASFFRLRPLQLRSVLLHYITVIRIPLVRRNLLPDIFLTRDPYFLEKTPNRVVLQTI